MNFTKLITGTIAGGITYFLLGWLFYGKLLVDFFNNHPGLTKGYNRPEPLWLFLVGANLVAGLLLAYIFSRLNVKSLNDAIVTATIIGALMIISFDAMMYATTTLTSGKALLADVAAFTVMSAVAGMVISFAGNLAGKKAS